jgi:hypothetical protein
MHIKRDIFPR